jgi:type IV pilus assembly protein PilE
MKSTRTHNRQRGVTLMELLVVMVVVAILAAVAIPSYRRYLIRAQRSDATTALLRLAAAQEKHFLQYGAYVIDTAELPDAHVDGGLGLSSTSDQGFYTLAVEGTVTGYDATATPIAGRGQDDDTVCATLFINETGRKWAENSGGGVSTPQCFR